MLDMGFKPAVDRIVAQTPSKRQTLFFSATLEGATGKIAAAYTRDARRHTQAQSEQGKADIEHRFLHVDSQSAKLDHLVEQLRGGERGRTLVFVRTKRGADRLVKRLRTHEVEAVAMHGDKSQGQRERALARFERGDVARPGRDRRRRPRHRRRRHHPRRQLRRPRGPRLLRAPDRPHRPGRQPAAPGSASCSPTRPTRSAAWPAPSASSASSTMAMAAMCTRRPPRSRSQRVRSTIRAAVAAARGRRDERAATAPANGPAPAAASPPAGSTAARHRCPIAGPAPPKAISA